MRKCTVPVHGLRCSQSENLITVKWRQVAGYRSVECRCRLLAIFNLSDHMHNATCNTVSDEYGPVSSDHSTLLCTLSVCASAKDVT